MEMFCQFLPLGTPGASLGQVHLPDSSPIALPLTPSVEWKVYLAASLILPLPCCS